MKLAKLFESVVYFSTLTFINTFASVSPYSLS